MDRGYEATGGAIEGEPCVLPGCALTETGQSLRVAPDRTGIRLVLLRQRARLDPCSAPCCRNRKPSVLSNSGAEIVWNSSPIEFRTIRGCNLREQPATKRVSHSARLGARRRRNAGADSEPDLQQSILFAREHDHISLLTGAIRPTRRSAAETGARSKSTPVPPDPSVGTTARFARARRDSSGSIWIAITRP